MTQILNGSAAIANHGGTAGYATTVVGPSRLVAHLGPPVSTSGSAARAAGVAVPRMQKIGPRAACFVLIWRSYRHAQVSRSSVYKLLHVPTIGQARVLCSLTFPGRPTPCITQICLYQPFSCWKKRIVLGHKRFGNVFGEVCPPLLLLLRTTLCCGFAQHSVNRLLRSPNSVTDGSVHAFLMALR